MNEVKLFGKTQKVEKSRLSAKNAISIISEDLETQKPKTLAKAPVTTPANKCPIKGCDRVFKMGRNTKANIKTHIKTCHGEKTQNSQKSQKSNKSKDDDVIEIVSDSSQDFKNTKNVILRQIPSIPEILDQIRNATATVPPPTSTVVAAHPKSSAEPGSAAASPVAETAPTPVASPPP